MLSSGPGFLKVCSSVVRRLRPEIVAAVGFLMLAVSVNVVAEVTVHLLPQPREVHLSGEIAILGGIRATAPGKDAEDEFAARDLEEAATESGLKRLLKNSSASAL